VPVRGRQILKAVYETEERSWPFMKKKSMGPSRNGAKGLLIEPTSAATIAGLKRYLDRKGRQETVVSTFTGTGLKSTEKTL